MDYNFYPLVIMRTPALSNEICFKEKVLLQQLADTIFFRNALWLASPVYYQSIEKSGFKIDSLSEKQQSTLKHYINRMQHRPTPFGLFAAISTIRWQEKPENPEPIIFGKKHALLLYPSFEIDVSNSHIQVADPILYSNPSIYKAAKEQRYLRMALAGNKIIYWLASVPCQGIMDTIRRCCQEPQSVSGILKFTGSRHGFARQELQQLIWEMAEAQYLLPAKGISPILNRAKSSLHARQADPFLDNIIRSEDNNNSSYSIYKRELESGTIPVRYQQSISDGMEALQLLAEQVSNKNLGNFKMAFSKKFGEAFIPLMLALDPASGIGYNNMETAYEQPGLLQGLAFAKDQIGHSKQWGNVHRLLANKLQQMQPYSSCGIVLQEADLMSLKSTSTPGLPLPTSTSVLFRPVNNGIYIEAMGGATATSLSGRFSIADEVIDKSCREIAGLEIKHNPDVVFAELNFAEELHAANIEQRFSFYDYQLPVMVCPGQPEAKQISLSDLLVSVRGGRIVLWSVSKKKEVICRLSTAYNYKRSTLGLYQFLCDLQHQGIRPSLTFDFTTAFPGLQFYPRVSYKTTLLSLASWRYSKKDFTTAAYDIAALKKLATDHKWPTIIAYCQGDRQLIFRTDDDSEMGGLLSRIKSSGDFTIKEQPFYDADFSILDPSGPTFTGQFVAMLYHTEKVYNGFSDNGYNFNLPKAIKRSDPNWLYFNLYCHEITGNDLLVQLRPLFNKFRKRSKEGLCFFVRYKDETGPHIRLRFYCPGPGLYNQTLLDCQRTFSGMMKNGQLLNLQMEPYQRELERYGASNILAVEKIFDASTQWILSHPEGFGADDNNYTMALLAAMDCLLGCFGCGLSSRIEFCHASFYSLVAETPDIKRLTHIVSEKFRDTKAVLIKDLPMAITQTKSFKKAKDCLDKVSALSESMHHSEPRLELCADLIHMHLNRAIALQPRKQEMVLYYYLWKYYSSLNARALSGQP